ncbi:RNA polymerase Rpb1, domain 2 family protein [Trichomonas vaginalis G3]|uniref:DNA-directed RNA polymerase subunit n=1 Tax=Trichomonas vaginalis (strain ATCC PRA-98 / G3) TaxID=412133 RepID=A2DEX5_TRIV3|nr:beta and beta-prime subunits of DNA dependent RNA-polymerase family [Trichomonas vaginalis G3]EAY20967.1 RNA polymerase Rpb1, domain 2 family protein [Trichomonas vaginalis G3]KAI5519127.1 beta and beta-prime subunits of DNA dependent RNA-polymerase family [Trichomonas vaginalis G3]|eukprot:XP_001581953.1 RNA polymerase Rpb1, domain 2 family protein [Trichomonas vaginalis G3]
MDTQEIRKLSTVFVHENELYEPRDLKPKVGGTLDLRLGAASKNQICQTCGQPQENCPGHFGSLELVLPVYNIGFYPAILHCLKCICKTCSNILLPNEEINSRLKKFYSKPPQTVSAKIDRVKALMKECEKVTICPHCGAINGPVKKTKTTLIITHNVGQKNDKLREPFLSKFSKLDIKGDDYKKYLDNICDDITPLRALQLFKAIPTRQIPLLLSGFSVSSPADMIITSIVIPPNCIRPAVIAAGEGTNQDDLTVRLVDSVHFNDEIRKSIEVGRQASSTMELWSSLQQNVNSSINSEAADTAAKTKKKNKPVIGVIQRLKGKQGRFRTNLSGKRVNYSGRTVISPDPNVNVDQVVIPVSMAKILTFPTRVTKFNKKDLMRYVKNGPDKYPGANNIIKADTGFKLSLAYGNKEQRAQELREGDIVERHLLDNDTVLFNRQPSLHRISIMGFRAKVMEWCTMRFNESVCAPFNADFDGDEMNVHLPQTLEAAADARYLMNVLYNLFSPRAGEMIVAPTQDFLSGAFILTRKNVFLDYSHFTFLISQIFDNLEEVDIPPPAIVKPYQLWTGKQVVSLMIAPNKKTDLHFTHQVGNKEYTGNKEMCKKDGYVSFLDNYMVSGVLEKSLIGGGPKSLWAIMARDHSPKFAAVCMQRIAKMSCRYLMNRGFSIGIMDVRPDENLTNNKNAQISKTYQDCYDKIAEYDSGKLEAAPGMTKLATLEAFLNGQLSELRNKIGKMCMAELSPINTPLVMAKSGAKGSDINICQMMACLGQQSVGGKRIIDDFIDRSIPHFKHGSKDPISKGFIASSFYTGLTPSDFFFHTMGGREGLVDAAVKTAQTGYMQRRLMKSLEDLVIAYDQTVRMSDGTIVQFTYGDDGLDPLNLETTYFPVDLNRVSQEYLFKFSQEPLMDQIEARERIETLFNDIREEQQGRGLVRVPEFLIDRLKKYIDDLLEKYIKANDQYIGEDLSMDSYIRATIPFTKSFLEEFVKFCMHRCEKSMAEPGMTVGAVAGQSIGEPATQMTLRSFHFAGVASMNVTLGVPRIEEVMNAVSEIKTPIITANLLSQRDEIAARIVKGIIDRVTLGQVCKHIEYNQNEKSCYIDIELDAEIIREAKLNITSETVRRSIVNTPKIGVKDENTANNGDYNVRVFMQGANPKAFSFIMQQLMLKLPDVVVSGVPGVERVHVGKENGCFKLFVEGNPFLKVLNTPGIDPKRTVSNHVLDVEKVLGVEAARSVIISEITNVMKNYSLNIDRRHLMLLSDLMTIRGKVLGVTRHGLAKTSVSSLKLASFETTQEHLFNAAFHNVDEVANGVSASVILGNFAPIGSGMIDVLVSDELLKRTSLTPRCHLIEDYINPMFLTAPYATNDGFLKPQFSVKSFLSLEKFLKSEFLTEQGYLKPQYLRLEKFLKKDLLAKDKDPNDPFKIYNEDGTVNQELLTKDGLLKRSVLDSEKYFSYDFITSEGMMSPRDLIKFDNLARNDHLRREFLGEDGLLKPEYLTEEGFVKEELQTKEGKPIPRSFMKHEFLTRDGLLKKEFYTSSGLLQAKNFLKLEYINTRGEPIPDFDLKPEYLTRDGMLKMEYIADDNGKNNKCYIKPEFMKQQYWWPKYTGPDYVKPELLNPENFVNPDYLKPQFLTPQPQSKYREQIEKGTFKPRK